MTNDTLAYIYSFSAVFTFSIAAIGFTYLSQKVTPLWMNVFKCLFSFLISLPLVIYLNNKVYWSFAESWPFYLSGIIGLNLGDWLLLNAYKRIGPARTLLLFGFQPLIAGGFSYFVWKEVVYPKQFIAIIFFVICLGLFSYERFRANRRWELAGLLFALGGVTLDSIGVILTRHGFNQSPHLTGIEVQYIRTLAALVSFVFLIPFFKINLIQNFISLTRNERVIAGMASLFGTFLSLAFYMQAVKIGKLAAVTSIVLTDPMMSTFFESVWLKKWPSRYMWYALISFGFAMYFLFSPRMH